MNRPERFLPSRRTLAAAHRSGFAQAPVLAGLAGCVLIGCAILGGGMSPSRFRACGAAIDAVLSVTIDEWIGEDTLTMPGLHPGRWIYFDDLIAYGASDLRRSEALIRFHDHRILEDLLSGDLVPGNLIPGDLGHVLQ